MIQNIERREDKIIVRSYLGTSFVHKCPAGMTLAFKKGKEAWLVREL